MKNWFGLWWFALAVSMSGCTVSIPEGRFGCANDNQCPSDWSCVEQRCYARTQDASADTGSDASEDATTDTGVDAATDTGVDASQDAGRDSEVEPDASVDANVDVDVDAARDGGTDSGTRECTSGFRLQGETCIDINECAFPVGPASSTRTAAQADTAANADANPIVATDNWVLLNAHFREGFWSDNSDLCGADQLTRDAFVRITLTRTTTLRLRARSDADTDLVMAVVPANTTMFILDNRAEDTTGSPVPCLSGSQDLSQSVRLLAGSYYVIVKANHRCDLDLPTCIGDPNATQDDPFSLEVRDLDLAAYPCDTNPLASCLNASGGFRCECPSGRDGDGIGPNGCI
jgi:hypothetical protein